MLGVGRWWWRWRCSRPLRRGTGFLNLPSCQRRGASDIKGGNGDGCGRSLGRLGRLRYKQMALVSVVWCHTGGKYPSFLVFFLPPTILWSRTKRKAEISGPDARNTALTYPRERQVRQDLLPHKTGGGGGHGQKRRHFWTQADIGRDAGNGERGFWLGRVNLERFLPWSYCCRDRGEVLFRMT